VLVIFAFRPKVRKLPLVKRTLIIVVMLCTAGYAAAQGTPAFSAYPANVERTRASRIDFRHSPGASSFRTRLNEALRGDVNFAGHYILTGWGCGTGCIYGAIIDARSGRVYFPEELAGLGTGYTKDGGYEDEPLKYRKNSRLLIISGVPGARTETATEKPQGAYCYEWKNGRLRLIKFIKSRTQRDGS
jgi:hypothetical protein